MIKLVMKTAITAAMVAASMAAIHLLGLKSTGLRRAFLGQFIRHDWL